jgi:hypothetical protein
MIILGISESRAACRFAAALSETQAWRGGSSRAIGDSLTMPRALTKSRQAVKRLNYDDVPVTNRRLCTGLSP